MKILSSIKNTLSHTRRRLRGAFSQMAFARSERKKESDELVASLHNAHTGRRAFIVCNGPSLRAADLTRIHDNADISIASNKIHQIFTQTPWRPTYYCAFDEVLQYHLDDILPVVSAQASFLRREAFNATRRFSQPIAWLRAYGSRSLLDTPRMSTDLSQGIFTIATVTYAMIQVALHMGIREIYIIGCDNKYAREVKQDGTIVTHGGPSYFAGAKPDAIPASTWEMNRAFENAARYAAANGISIFNATRGGYLEAFPRVDFDTLF